MCVCFMDNQRIKQEPAEISEHIEFHVDAFLDTIPKSPTKQGPQGYEIWCHCT